MIFGRKKTKGCHAICDRDRRIEELTYDNKLLKENGRMLKAAHITDEAAGFIRENARMLREDILALENYRYEDRDEIFASIHRTMDSIRDNWELLREVNSITFTIDEDDEDYGTRRKVNRYMGKYDDDYCLKDEYRGEVAEICDDYDDYEEEDE